jgi:hypothetical protein
MASGVPTIETLTKALDGAARAQCKRTALPANDGMCSPDRFNSAVGPIGGGPFRAGSPSAWLGWGEDQRNAPGSLARVVRGRVIGALSRARLATPPPARLSPF